MVYILGQPCTFNSSSDNPARAPLMWSGQMVRLEELLLPPPRPPAGSLQLIAPEFDSEVNPLRVS